MEHVKVYLRSLIGKEAFMAAISFVMALAIASMPGSSHASQPESTGLHERGMPGIDKARIEAISTIAKKVEPIEKPWSIVDPAAMKAMSTPNEKEPSKVARTVPWRAPQPSKRRETAEEPMPNAAPLQRGRGALSRKQVVSLLLEAAAAYKIDQKTARWLAQKGADVAYRESRYNPSAIRRGKTTTYVGLFQFNDGWGTMKERLDPRWSCRRFVKVYVEAGVKGLKRHWKATFR